MTAARGSDFFGPWGLPTAAMGERTFYPMLHGKAAGLVGNIDVPHTHTYVPDFGKALVVLGERPEADGPQAQYVKSALPDYAFIGYRREGGGKHCGA